MSFGKYSGTIIKKSFQEKTAVKNFRKSLQEKSFSQISEFSSPSPQSQVKVLARVNTTPINEALTLVIIKFSVVLSEKV